MDRLEPAPASGSCAAAADIAALARRAAAGTPADAAFIEGERQLGFREVYDEALRLATALERLGLKPGEVLSFQLPNWAEAAVINLAACLGGWICNPIVPIYREAEMVGMLGDCRSRLIFVPGSWRGVDYAAMAARVAAAVPSLQHIVVVRGEGALQYRRLVDAALPPRTDWPGVEPSALKLIMYTSGTTGAAKGVRHSHASLPVGVESATRHWGLGRGDRVLMPSPVTHATGYCAGLELPFATGMATVLMERWDAAEAVRLILRHRATVAVGATPFLQELLEAVDAAGMERLPLKLFVCGGAAVPPELIRRAATRLAGYACRAYGSTESPFVTFGCEPGDAGEIGAGTDGRINGYEVRIVDAGGAEAAPGSDGEILVRGKGLFLGYTSAAATGEAFTADGFFRTGDIGVVGAADTLTVTGRKKDLIIRGGENISAKEIEDVLLTHPEVIEASVVAAPHPRLGETVAAFLRTRNGAALEAGQVAELVMRSGLARQKCPEHIRVLEEFPRTASGKVRKDLLRQAIRDELRGAAARG